MSSGITITSASADISERDMEVEDEAEVDGTSMWKDIGRRPASDSVREDTSIFVGRIEPCRGACYSTCSSLVHTVNLEIRLNKLL